MSRRQPLSLQNRAGDGQQHHSENGAHKNRALRKPARKGEPPESCVPSRAAPTAQWAGEGPDQDVEDIRAVLLPLLCVHTTGGGSPS